MNIPSTSRKLHGINIAQKAIPIYRGAPIYCVLHHNQHGYVLIGLNADKRQSKFWCDFKGILNVRYTYVETNHIPNIVKRIQPKILYTNDASLLVDLFPTPPNCKGSEGKPSQPQRVKKDSTKGDEKESKLNFELRMYEGYHLLDLLESIALEEDLPTLFHNVNLHPRTAESSNVKPKETIRTAREKENKE
ncbi:unnamed protein product [Bemisia tabaci]|uniref:Uncharacterized protein n=1 Tax=Bemisia tabaci TaxID=7038 RepID=A0A9P0AJS2_BEMTA|nr:unnamed protein product [Bemisia tabaci]